MYKAVTVAPECVCVDFGGGNVTCVVMSLPFSSLWSTPALD